MTIECATAKVRPVFDDEPTAFMCAAHFEHPADGAAWVSVGAGATAADAQEDLLAVLEEEGVVAPDLVECHNEENRRNLLWSAKSRAMMQGNPVAIVREA